MEQAWLNLDITIDDNNLSMKLINGMPAGIYDGTAHEEESLDNVQKRLQLLYPGRHDLKINAKQELLMVHLNLKLEEPIPEGQSTIESTKTALNYAGI